MERSLSRGRGGVNARLVARPEPRRLVRARLVAAVAVAALGVTAGSACRDGASEGREASAAAALPAKAWKKALAKPLLEEGQATREVLALLKPLLPPLPSPTTALEWEAERERLRRRFLDEIVLRGEAKAWDTQPVKVEWGETLEGGPHHRVRKLRYEIIPGLWVPALLYEPKALAGPAPVALHLNRHGRTSDMASYDEQVRCINLARRGVISLEVEWFGQGLLKTRGFRHTRMNQLDLVGTSGLAPFWLLMRKGLDVLLAHPRADASRVAVTGLSGGGWQTILLSALDRRVTVANPVSGYAALSTRLAHEDDLGDSEQTPSDAFTVLEYTHLTAMVAPRPLLLTYSAKDNCCFRSDRALRPLLDAARPFYALYGATDRLTSHINHRPGTHNYKSDNRRAFYRLLAEHFFAGDDGHGAKDLDVRAQVKERADLGVALPADQLDFHTLAVDIASRLERRPLPIDAAAAAAWQRSARQRLKEVVRVRDLRVVEVSTSELESMEGVTRRAHELRLDHGLTVPVLELAREGAKDAALVVGDKGRASLVARVREQLAAGKRVLVLDLIHFGERRLKPNDWLVALLISALGERSLGIQAGELAAVARWSRTALGASAVTLVADGPRTSTAALVAAATARDDVSALSLHGAYATLRELLRRDLTVEHAPELFVFGLLQEADVRDMIALVAPRPVELRAASEGARAELSELPAFYALLGTPFDPLAP